MHWGSSVGSFKNNPESAKKTQHKTKRFVIGHNTPYKNQNKFGTHGMCSFKHSGLSETEKYKNVGNSIKKRGSS